MRHGLGILDRNHFPLIKFLDHRTAPYHLVRHRNVLPIDRKNPVSNRYVRVIYDDHFAIQYG